MKLICLGDSLTFGYGVRASQRWTHLCAQHTGWKIVNEGVSGDTTGGMLARLAARVLPELRSGSADEPFQRILLMGGTNDVFYSGSDVSARANMGAMIHQLLSAGVLPLVGIPLPVDDRHAPGEWASVVVFPGRKPSCGSIACGSGDSARPSACRVWIFTQILSGRTERPGRSCCCTACTPRRRDIS